MGTSGQQRAVIYVRVSLDQTGERAGVERQRADCLALAQRRGWDVVQVIEDNDTSARVAHSRPGWNQVMELARSGEISYIVAWHFDRATRSMVELEDLIQLAETTGVGIAFAEGELDLTNATGRLNARILAAVARGEIERKGARHRAANAHRARTGKPFWTRRPFGYEKTAEIREDEAELLRDAYHSVIEGEPVTAIARRWNAQGVLTSTGVEWKTTTLKQLLLSPRNAGIRTHNGSEVARGTWDPIVDEETYRAACRELARKKPGGNRTGRRSDSLLHGLLFCSSCGSRMSITWRGSGESRYRLYGCIHKATTAKGAKGGCQTQRADWLEDLVLGLVHDELHDAEKAALLWPKDESAQDDIRAVEHELSLVEEKARALAEDYADDILTRDEYMAARGRLSERRTAAEEKLGKLRARTAVSGLSVTREEALARWEQLNPRQHRVIMEGMVEKVLAEPRGRLNPRDLAAVYNPDKIHVQWREPELVDRAS